MNLRALSLFAFGGVCAMFVAGCGGTGDLKGKVTYKGSPLKGGYISFMSTDNAQSFASIIAEDGSYLIAGMKSGTYKVSVDTEMLKSGGAGAGGGMPSGSSSRSGGPPKPQGPPSDSKDKTKVPSSDAMAAAAAAGYTPGQSPGAALKANAERYVQIPSAYAKPDTTPLTYEYPGGNRTYDVEVK